MENRPAWIEGVLDSLPICASFVFVFSGVGALAREMGFTLWQSTLSTALIFAAPLQAFVSGLMEKGDIVLLLSATVLANFRFTLMGAVVKRYFAGVARWRIYASMFFLSASTYAVTHTGLSRRRLSGQQQFNYFLGVSIPCYCVAAVASVIGYVFLAAQAGSFISHLAMAVLPIHFSSLTAKRKEESGVLACTLAGMAVAPLLAQSHAITLNVAAPVAIGFAAALIVKSFSKSRATC
jgi:predicted branched-subunit amino acid permease